MALNEFMHPRNPYKLNPPDFKKLAERYPDFKKHVHFSKAGKPFVNFRIPEVVRSLAICLFDKDYNLQIQLPSDRLAPTLPSRINYILWVEDLLNCLSNVESNITILDVGCGSSCVYPLLGCRINPSWTFIATEIDERNISFAKKNVENNELSEKITIKQADKNAALLENCGFDICMCNPPFFLYFLKY